MNRSRSKSPKPAAAIPNEIKKSAYDKVDQAKMFAAKPAGAVPKPQSNKDQN